MIYPPLNGGEGRIFNLLRGLSKRYRISIMVPRQDNREEEYRAAAMELQHGLVNKVHLAEELGQALEQALQDEKIDIVQFEFHEMGRYARFVRGRVSTIITEHDAGFLSWKRSYIRPPVSRYPGESLVNFAWQWLEAARLFRHCDHLVAVSQTDARLLNRLAARHKIRVVPHGVDLDEFPFRGLARRHAGGVVFVGHYPHYPNEDAALYLCREIWPLLRQKVPEASLQLIGSFPTQRIMVQETRSIQVVGTVASVEPFLAKARLFAAPVRLGMGVKGKILEACASGVPVVAMRRACEGIPELRDGRHLMMADTAQEFAAKAAQLLLDDELSSQLALRARELVENYYSCDKLAEGLDRLYQEILRRRQ
ncbi:MAG: hypothetical protein A3J74_01465 [Elusimicrobia bacterium RIFCSPHIGHO2_02_FULL_57_9]|nr:MAG: hypothetical protein A3J74_01465 [Elusimicrobia bacterium RIFCSPHIGHO2_02_FULL_57_9]